GARVDFAKPNPIAWAVACPLADTPRFFAQLDALLKHFDVPVTREAGNDVRQSVLKIPFAFGPSCGCLVIADSPTTIAEMKPRAAVHRPRRAALDACLGHLFDPNLSCLLVDLRAVGKALGPFASALGQAKPLLSNGAFGLGVGRVADHVHARLT